MRLPPLLCALYLARKGSTIPVFCSPPAPSQLPAPQPSQSQASHFLQRALGVAGLCVFLVGAGTSQRVRPERLAPQTELEVAVLAAAPGACVPAERLTVQQGQPPSQALVTHRLLWRTKTPLPLSYAEKELVAEAGRLCGQGLSLQQAIADDGARGVLEVRAVVWTLPTSPPP